jgi:hypothetical protein
MSEPCQPGAGPPALAPPPAGSLDAQVMATWQALLLNPDLDPRHALHAIDRLLDQRTRHAANPTAPARPLNRALPAGSAAQHAILAEVLAMLLEPM